METIVGILTCDHCGQQVVYGQAHDCSPPITLHPEEIKSLDLSDPFTGLGYREYQQLREKQERDRRKFL